VKYFALTLAMLAVGFFLGRLSVEEGNPIGRAPRAPDRAAIDGARPPATASTAGSTEAPAAAARRPEPSAPHAGMGVERFSPPAATDGGPEKAPPQDRPARAIYGTRKWDGDRFVHWYRAHAATYKFSGKEERELRLFGENVVSMLGRVPRREILEALLAAHAPLHRAIVEVEAAQRAGDISRREAIARLAPARRMYSDRLYRALAYSDYVVLTREWVDDKNPYFHVVIRKPPTDPRPKGADPFALKVRDSDAFATWYEAYRRELALPPRDHDFLSSFFSDIVGPLRRVPRPNLMRTLQTHYEKFIETPDRGDGDAIPNLFRSLRAVLTPLDFDHIRWSQNWAQTLEDLGIEKTR